jgi:hypothetical protein
VNIKINVMGSHVANSGSFKKGDKRQRPKQIGDIGSEQRIKKMLQREAIQDEIECTVIPKILEELSQLDGRDYIVGALGILEYYKPKLARKEVIGDKQKIAINVFGKNQPQIVDRVGDGENNNEITNDIESEDVSPLDD